MKKIKVNQNKEILIDDEDFDLISKYTWSIFKQPNRYTYYATTHVYRKRKRTTLRLGRLILGLLPGDKRQVDHINRNGLDHRRCNLRICTCQQNQLNKRVYGKSKYKGVSFNKNGKLFAQIVRNKKHIRLGTFRTEKEAAKAYQDVLLKLEETK